MRTTACYLPPKPQMCPILSDSMLQQHLTGHKLSAQIILHVQLVPTSPSTSLKSHAQACPVNVQSHVHVTYPEHAAFLPAKNTHDIHSHSIVRKTVSLVALQMISQCTELRGSRPDKLVTTTQCRAIKYLSLCRTRNLQPTCRPAR